MKKYLILMLLFVFMFPVSLSADDRISNNYNYDSRGNEIASSPTFNVVHKINQNTSGIEFGEVVDVVGYDELIYIVDNTNDTIYVFDTQYNLVDSIKDLGSGGELDNPSSVDVNDDYIVVADTGNKRIVKLDHDYKYVGEISSFDTNGLEDGFIPIKVAISNANDIYIIAQGVYEGIISCDFDGNFIKYNGTNKVDISLMDRFWRSIASDEQLSQMQDFLPTEFTSLSIDGDGFIYTTTTSDENEPIKKLNTNGENVLVYPKGNPPVGDLEVNNQRGQTQLSAIDINDEGYYAVLDSTTGRVFIYDEEGFLLSIYGNLGTEGDHFRTPVALSWFGNDTLLVADKVNKEVIVLEATDFLKTVFEATTEYYNNNMDVAEELWKDALNYNTNYETAYLGLGRVYLRTGEYELAAENFELANNKQYYSKAFEEIRAEFIRNHFFIISVLFIGFLVVVYRALGDGKNA